MRVKVFSTTLRNEGDANINNKKVKTNEKKSSNYCIKNVNKYCI